MQACLGVKSRIAHGSWRSANCELALHQGRLGAQGGAVEQGETCTSPAAKMHIRSGVVDSQKGEVL